MPEFVTDALDPGAPVDTVPTVNVAASPSEPVGPVGPVALVLYGNYFLLQNK